MQKRITDATNAIDMYLELVEMSEPPLLFHRWCFIACVSAALGRNVWLQFGDEKIYPNQFITLIGNPGSRKSTAINTATGMLKDSGYEYFSSDRSSKEKFLADWEHGFDKINKGIEPNSKNDIDEIDEALGLDGHNTTAVSEVTIKAGELEDFLGSGNSNFITTMTNLWDNLPHYSDRLKNSKSLFIPNPTINMIGGATTTTFASIFSATIIGQGMLSRMILVHGSGQRMRLTIPPRLDPEGRGFIVKLLRSIRMDIMGEIIITPEAYEAIDYIYQNWENLPDSRLVSYSNRRLTHLLKLCLVLAAAELEKEITLDTVILANSILTYTELHMPTALGEFGKSKSSEISQIVLDAIKSCEVTGGVTLPDLLKMVSQDIDSIHELGSLTQKLVSGDKIRLATNHQLGCKVFLPVKTKTKLDSKYVNLDLLYEYRFGENK